MPKHKGYLTTTNPKSKLILKLYVAKAFLHSGTTWVGTGCIGLVLGREWEKLWLYLIIPLKSLTIFLLSLESLLSFRQCLKSRRCWQDGSTAGNWDYCFD